MNIGKISRACCKQNVHRSLNDPQAFVSPEDILFKQERPLESWRMSCCSQLCQDSLVIMYCLHLLSRISWCVLATRCIQLCSVSGTNPEPALRSASNNGDWWEVSRTVQNQHNSKSPFSMVGSIVSMARIRSTSFHAKPLAFVLVQYEAECIDQASVFPRLMRWSTTLFNPGRPFDMLSNNVSMPINLLPFAKYLSSSFGYS